MCDRMTPLRLCVLMALMMSFAFAYISAGCFAAECFLFLFASALVVRGSCGFLTGVRHANFVASLMEFVFASSI
jgi:hypothetical protein